MLLRNPISSTKKFFQKTLQTVKSFLSGGNYERLPKNPPPHFNSPTCRPKVDTNFHSSYNLEMGNFYGDFSGRWDSDAGKPRRRNKKKMENIVSASPTKKQGKEEGYGSSAGNYVENVKHSIADRESTRATGNDYNKKRMVMKREEEERSGLVAEKLRELEMMDVSNVEHVLDIEEVLHYYSRLTCPAYVDIVDRFFMEMYSEFVVLPAPATPAKYSRPGLQRSGMW